jgi:hypothetical protein
MDGARDIVPANLKLHEKGDFQFNLLIGKLFHFTGEWTRRVGDVP